jgi:Tfp pilus assembly protein PilF
MMFNDAAAYLNKGDDAGAKPILEKILDSDPEYPDALFQLGMIHLRAGDNAKAKELLQKFLKVAPSHRDAPSATEMLKYL